MQTMVYLVKSSSNVDLTPAEQTFVAPISEAGITVPDLSEALGRPVKTRSERSAFYSLLRALVEKGVLQTKTVERIAA